MSPHRSQSHHVFCLKVYLHLTLLFTNKMPRDWNYFDCLEIGKRFVRSTRRLDRDFKANVIDFKPMATPHWLCKYQKFNHKIEKRANLDSNHYMVKSVHRCRISKIGGIKSNPLKKLDVGKLKNDLIARTIRSYSSESHGESYKRHLVWPKLRYQNSGRNG